MTASNAAMCKIYEFLYLFVYLCFYDPLSAQTGLISYFVPCFGLLLDTGHILRKVNNCAETKNSDLKKSKKLLSSPENFRRPFFSHLLDFYISTTHMAPVADPGGGKSGHGPPLKLAMEFGPLGAERVMIAL